MMDGTDEGRRACAWRWRYLCAHGCALTAGTDVWNQNELLESFGLTKRDKMPKGLPFVSRPCPTITFTSSGSLQMREISFRCGIDRRKGVKCRC